MTAGTCAATGAGGVGADRTRRSRTPDVHVLDAPAAAGADRRARASCTSAASSWPGATCGRPEPDRRAVRRPTRSAGPGARLYRTGDLARWRAGRRAGVPRPARPPGEDPRATASSWARSRHALADHPAVGRQWWSPRAGRDGPQLAAYVAGRRCRRRPRCATHLAQRLPRVHGARGDRGAGRAAADPQRQGGPRGTARSGSARRRCAAGGPPVTPQEKAIADVFAGRARVDRGGRDRQLLRPRRRLVRRDPRGPAHSRCQRRTPRRPSERTGAGGGAARRPARPRAGCCA